MKKDIEIPEVKNVYVAIVKEQNKEFGDEEWNSYVINDQDVDIEMVMVVTKGYDTERKTSVLRHGLGTIAAKSSSKVEMLQEAVFEMNNEFAVTYFAKGKMYDKKYIFRKNTINEQAFQNIPTMDKRGVLVK